MTKYISGRVKDLKVGLNAYSEDKVSLDVVGIVSVKDVLKVGAGITMDAASGIISATSFKGSSGVDATFVGDGSGLSGVVGSGAGVIIRDDNDLVGTAGTINFGTNLNVTAISVGVVTVTASIPSTDNATNLVGGFARASELDVSGISTFVGLSTFNNGLIVHAGVSTFNDDIKGDNTTNISGISSVTALTFYGNGQYLTGTQATGNATLGDLKVSGISTFVGLSTFNNGLIVHAGVTTVSDSLEVGLGITAHAGVITATKFDGNAAGLIGSPNIIVGTIVGASLSVTGIATITDVWGQSATLKIGTGITANGGIITATTFDGALDGNATTATNASGLTGTPDIIVSNIVGTALSISGISTFTDNVTVGSAITIGAISGIITAASYRGDGSLLSGITASGTGVQIKDSGTPVGAAGTIDFGKNLIVGEIVDSVATVTGIGTEFIKAESLNVSGISTFVGLSTFNNGLIVHAGVSTFHGEIHALSNVGIGTTNPQADLQVGTGVTVYGNSGIVSATTYYGSGANLTDIDTTQIQTGNTSVQTIDTGSDGHVKVTTEGTERFRITSNGDVGIGTDNPTGVNAVGTGNTAVLAVGIITASQINASGITSASAFANFDYLQAPYGSTTTFTVTVASKDATHRYQGEGSSSGYLINGVQAPVLTLTPGRTYRFTNDNTGTHPLKFYYEADKTTLYTTGVNFQDAYTEITVSDTTPNVLHYQCTAHVKMGNAVITNSNVVDTPYTLKVGTGITASAGIITATKFIVTDGSGTQFLKADGSLDSTNYAGSTDRVVGTALSISGIGTVADTLKVGIAITAHAGVITANTFKGDNLYGTLQTGNQPQITTVGTLGSLSVTGDVSIGGTLTYDDVTNIDSVGLVTAREGIHVVSGAGVSIAAGGLSVSAGIGTISDTLKVGTAITAHAGVITATKFVVTDGSGTQFLKADGTLDSTNYAGSTDRVVGTALSISGIGTIGDTLKVGIAITAHAGVVTATTFDGDPSNTNAHSLWLVTANGSSAYRFTGPGQDGSDDDPDVYLVRGQRYIFTNNSGGSHPFEIRVASGGAAYSTGVTNNGASSGNIIFNVQHDAPPRLYYQCTNHSAMVGNIYVIGGPQVISGVVTATTFSANNAKFSDLSANRVVYSSSADGELSDSANLTFNGTTLTGTFAGDGSSLDGITASGIGAIGGLTVKTQGTNVGTAGSISNLDFRGTVNVIANTGASGVATITVAGVSTGIGTWSASEGVSNDIDEWSFLESDDLKFVEYTVHIIHSTGMQAQKVLVMNDYGTSYNNPVVYSNEYAIMHTTTNPIVSIAATIDSASPSKVYLAATPTSGVTGLTTYRVLRIGEMM